MKKTLGIVVLKKEYVTGKELGNLLESLTLCVDALSIMCKDLDDILFCDNSVKKCISNLPVYKTYQEILSQVDMSQYEKIIMCDNSFFGPFQPWETYFKEAECEEWDYWGLEERTKHIDEYGIVRASFLRWYFVVLKSAVWSLEEVIRYWDMHDISEEELGHVLHEKGFYYGAEVCGNMDENVFKEESGIIRPYVLLKQNFPILRKDAFNIERLENLEFHYANQLEGAIAFIREKCGYDVNLIYDYVIKCFPPCKMNELLNTNYILDGRLGHDTDWEVYNRTAIAAHLFYSDMFAETLYYLSNVPEQIDVFITVSSYEAKKILEDMITVNKTRYHILVASNVGRDWGALVLDLWPHLEKYDYICFLHDKKTTGGKGYASVGQAFMEMTWECMVHSKRYVEQVLELFETNSRLGLLAPPKPYHSGYIKLMGDPWTVCYDEAQLLWDKLGYKTQLDKASRPFALSSMFWFRKDALLPIFSGAIKDKDFPKEPMPTDGTLSHALERIVVYVAKEQGYYCGTVQEKSNAQTNITNYECLLGKIIRDSLMTFGDQPIGRMFSGKNYYERLSMLRFAMSGNDLYVYGAGNNGIRVAEFLEQQQIVMKGFVVSDGYRKQNWLKGHLVYEICEIPKEANIIVAVDRIYIDEILKKLEVSSYNNIFVLEI